jgi:hypothetical protein
MNVDELTAKMDEILSWAKRTHLEVLDLRDKAESLQRTVDDLQERLTYREKVLVGWKEIAMHLECDPAWAQKMAAEPFDPLPVLREDRHVVAFASALDAHRIRRRSPHNAEKRKVMRLVPRESTGPTS